MGITVGKKISAPANEELSTKMVRVWRVCGCTHVPVAGEAGCWWGTEEAAENVQALGWGLVCSCATLQGSDPRVWSESKPGKPLCSAVARGNYRKPRRLPRCRCSQLPEQGREVESSPKKNHTEAIWGGKAWA